MKRRNFLKGLSTLAASITAINTSPLVSGTVNSQHKAPLHLVYDKRHISLDDIRIASPVNIEKFYPIEGGSSLTNIWYNDLYYQWKERGQATVGFTGDAEFFVLKTLARDQGYSVLHEERKGSLVSWILGPGTREQFAFHAENNARETGSHGRAV